MSITENILKKRDPNALRRAYRIASALIRQQVQAGIEEELEPILRWIAEKLDQKADALMIQKEKNR